MSHFHPGAHVDSRGDAAAVIMGSGERTVTYGQLEENSSRFANLLRSSGLVPGDHIAILLENHPRYFEIFWGAQRAGLYTTPINWHLQAVEAGYIVEDCGASVLVTSTHLAELVGRLDSHLAAVRRRLVVDGEADGFESYEQALAQHPAEPASDEVEGSWMFYSSGTTGRPKGIKPPLSDAPYGHGGGALGQLLQHMYGFTPDAIYLCPAPLYHAAPLGWSTSTQRLGGTVVVMERFDAEEALRLIERHRVTHAQFVPTHFVRMLQLDPSVRARYDLSSLSTVVHAAAPCPIPVKRAMIEWLGPIVHEYYAGSEGNGFCAIDSADWLAHPGSVGRALVGVPHIVGEDGNEVGPGEPGQIWFESDVKFEYHNDPEKTAKAYDRHGWTSLGDIGYLDADGYLYLTDRASHMIISGGVNIYPQEVENLLSVYPGIVDVAVIGVPNADLGEEVKAVVVPAGEAADGELAAKIIEHCRANLAHYKCPVSVDFVDELPRLPTGKLLKRELRERYWPAAG